MAKIHITLVGGQTAPVYYGIVDSNPDIVILICSSQTEHEGSLISNLIHVDSKVVNLDPCNLNKIEEKINEISRQYKNDEVSINLSGGTKFWSLYFYEKYPNATFICIDQNNRLWNMKTKEFHFVKFDITTQFKLYGNPLVDYRSFNSYTKEDALVCYEVEMLRQINISAFNQILTVFDAKKNNYFKSHNVGEFLSENPDSFVKWDKTTNEVEVQISNKKKNVHKFFTSPHVFEIVFRSGWFEYKVAQMINRSDMVREIRMNCVFPANNNLPKNEVDIIVDMGSKLLFVECKTQIKEITILDKFASVVKNYGGLSSKGLFVTDAPLKDITIQKCKDNDLLMFDLSDGDASEKQFINMIENEMLKTNKR